jgi:hypothetical protein
MKIAIIGGGISGLYAAQILTELGHKITIYEKDKFGGCIEYIYYKNKYYPLSALYIIGDNKYMINFIKNNKLETLKCEYYLKNYHIIKRRLNMYFILTMFISYLFKKNIIYHIIILLILLYPTETKIKEANIFQKNLLIELIYPVCLAWGGHSNIDKFIESKTSEYNYLNIFSLILTVYTHKILKSLGNKSYYHFIEHFMKNKKIDYQIKNISSIIRLGNKIKISYNNQFKIFDKVILACNPLNIPIQLSSFESKYINKIDRGFDFYSTFIHIKDESLNISNNITGYIKLDDNIYLCSSNVPITKDDFDNKIIYIQCNKYLMGIKYDEQTLNIIENKINGKNNIHLIGRHMTIDGISTCLDYVEKHLNKYFNYKMTNKSNIKFIYDYINL